jgi:two-component system sensor histidine kinase BaeS
MRRRLVFAIVGVVVGALLVSGLGTLVLARRAARQQTRSELTQEARALATTTDALTNVVQLPALRRSMRLEGAAVIRIGTNGCPVPAADGQLPPGVTLGPSACTALAAATGVSGARADLAWAAAPIVRRGRPVGAVVLSRRIVGFRRGAGYLLISGALALAAAVAVAEWLSVRIARPLRDAEAATRRIAAGDLGATVPVPDQSYPELSSLAHSINSMAESLGRAKNLERQFLLSVSHDLRTPLTSIRGYAEAIGDGTATDTARAAEVISSESRRLERLVGDLLDLAKLDARRFSLDLQAVDAAEVAAGIADSFAPAASEAGLSLNVDGAGLPLVVRADPDRLAQVVANLVENAFKFAGSAIRVAASRQDGEVVLTVEDDGPGIPAAEVSRVFERMYQSPRTPARQAGSGLGLAIVAELVGAMGGRVQAVSPVLDSRGTRLEVRLPASG